MSRRPSHRPSRERPPLDRAGLDALALAYVGRYATSRAILARYLHRKLRERGWGDADAAPVEAVVERCARLGYVDDAAFAAAKGGALGRRGFGERRVAAALTVAGIDADTSAPVRAAAQDEALDRALAFARRRRIGPFATAPREPDQRRRDIAALMRAGHALALARHVAEMHPEELEISGD